MPDDPKPCDHSNSMLLISGNGYILFWCRDCGSIRVGAVWILPKSELALKLPEAKTV